MMVESDKEPLVVMLKGIGRTIREYQESGKPLDRLTLALERDGRLLMVKASEGDGYLMLPILRDDMVMTPNKE